MTDAEIRAAGYTIHARPKDGEPVWRRKETGELFRQSHLLFLLTGSVDGEPPRRSERPLRRHPRDRR